MEGGDKRHAPLSLERHHPDARHAETGVNQSEGALLQQLCQDPVLRIDIHGFVVEGASVDAFPAKNIWLVTLKLPDFTVDERFADWQKRGTYNSNAVQKAFLPYCISLLYDGSGRCV